jgi:hypothetical protein
VQAGCMQVCGCSLLLTCMQLCSRIRSHACRNEAPTKAWHLVTLLTRRAMSGDQLNRCGRSRHTPVALARGWHCGQQDETPLRVTNLDKLHPSGTARTQNTHPYDIACVMSGKSAACLCCVVPRKTREFVYTSTAHVYQLMQSPFTQHR